jgi:1-acyl-sn-glycerol-3-phosphate acyltransferase
MQNIVIDKPYRFVPPYTGRLWFRLFRYYLPHYLRKTWGIEKAEYHGIDGLKASLAAGHGIVLAPNHSRPCDPMVMGLLEKQMDSPFYVMTSWHLFMEGAMRRWLIRRLGAFSVYREGMDREALRTAITILAENQRPLILFPEGVVTRANDRLGTLQDGVAFIARSAARQRAKLTPAGKVVIHPVAIKYFFEGDLAASVSPVLEWLETRIGWRPQRELPLVERIHKAGGALLALKEIEHLGQAQPGAVADRLAVLIDFLLLPLEKEWLGGHREPSVVERVKRLRTAIVPDLITGEITEAERTRRWRQLADVYFAQQLDCYPPNYLGGQTTPERILETVERFEEDLTDTARIHRPLRVVIQVGQALEVSPARERGAGEDPLMKSLQEQMQGLLQGLTSGRQPFQGH